MQQKYSEGKWKEAKRVFRKCRRIDKKRLKQAKGERVQNGVYRA